MIPEWPIIQATQAFSIAVPVATSVAKVGFETQSVVTGGALSVIGLIIGGLAALYFLIRLARRSIHVH